VSGLDMKRLRKEIGVRIKKRDYFVAYVPRNDRAGPGAM